MIEVEKKFQPTLEQLAAFVEDAEFLGEIENIDTYYDMPDFALGKKGFKLRQRNKDYELKVQMSNFNDYTQANYDEITEEPKILEKLGYPNDANLEQIIRDKMEILCSIRTKRKKYKKAGFNIDVDETDFGYNMVEIEFMVNNESEISDAEKKIEIFGQPISNLGKKLPGKVVECIRITRPDVYKILYPNN